MKDQLALNLFFLTSRVIWYVTKATCRLPHLHKAKEDPQTRKQGVFTWVSPKCRGLRQGFACMQLMWKWPRATGVGTGKSLTAKEESYPKGWTSHPWGLGPMWTLWLCLRIVQRGDKREKYLSTSFYPPAVRGEPCNGNSLGHPDMYIGQNTTAEKPGAESCRDEVYTCQRFAQHSWNKRVAERRGAGTHLIQRIDHPIYQHFTGVISERLSLLIFTILHTSPH